MRPVTVDILMRKQKELLPVNPFGQGKRSKISGAHDNRNYGSSILFTESPDRDSLEMIRRSNITPSPDKGMFFLDPNSTVVQNRISDRRTLY